MLESLSTPSLHLPSRLNPQPICETPNSYKNPSANRYYLGLRNSFVSFCAFCLCHHDFIFLSLSFITPVVKRGPEVSSSAVAAHRVGPVQQPFTPLNQAPCFQTPQVKHVHFSHSEDILHVSLNKFFHDTRHPS